MKPNIGTADRAIRILLGLAIIVLGVILHSWWGLVGLLPIVTGLVRMCGLYSIFGINTCNVENASPKR